jgi:hydroxyquinol 1,2-dioxygenase
VVFGVKDSLIRAFSEKPAGPAPDGTEPREPYRHLHYDFALAPERR